MKYSILLSLLSFASADVPTDYWYRLCSKDANKNAAVKAACPGKGKKLNTCLLDSEMYQRSLFACFEACEARSNHTNPDAYELSWGYMAEKLGGEQSLTIADLEQMERDDPVTMSYKEANETETGPFLPRPKWLTDLNIAAQSDWTYQKQLAQLMGQISIYYVAGIIVLQTLFHALTWVAPAVVRLVSNNFVSRYIRRYAVLPALFNKHRSAPLRVIRYIQLCFPPRLHVLLLLGYLVICIVGLAYHYPIILSPAVSKTSSDYIASNLAYRASGMLMYKLPLLFLFAGRNNFMIWLTGWQMEVFCHWHRWIARLATIDMLIHAIAFCIKDAGPTFYEKRASAGWWRVGVVGGIVMLIMIVQATKTFRAPAYETFLTIHILLATIFVVTSWYHVKTHNFGTYEMYSVIAIWSFEHLCRIVRIFIGGLNNKATLRVLSDDLLEVTVKYSGWWKPQPGAYVFLHFANKLGFLQSHPLSVIPVDSSTIKFVSRAQKGMTRVMHDRTLANGGPLECRVWLDGPYGIHFPTRQFKELVTIAGGIGFTSVYSHTIEMLRRDQGQTVYMHWALSNREPLEAFAAEIKTLQSYSNLKLTVYLPGGHVPSDDSEKEKSESISTDSSLEIVGVDFAPNFKGLIGDHIKNSEGPICFFSCGPPPMADAVRDSVATELLSSKHYVQFYEESFSI